MMIDWEAMRAHRESVLALCKEAIEHFDMLHNGLGFPPDVATAKALQEIREGIDADLAPITPIRPLAAGPRPPRRQY